MVGGLGATLHSQFSMSRLSGEWQSLVAPLLTTPPRRYPDWQALTTPLLVRAGQRSRLRLAQDSIRLLLEQCTPPLSSSYSSSHLVSLAFPSYPWRPWRLVRSPPTPPSPPTLRLNLLRARLDDPLTLRGATTFRDALRLLSSSSSLSGVRARHGGAGAALLAAYPEAPLTLLPPPTPSLLLDSLLLSRGVRRYPEAGQLGHGSLPRPLLEQHSSSPLRLLMALLPAYPWRTWHLPLPPHHHYSHPLHRAQLVAHLNLHFTLSEGNWRRISQKQLTRLKLEGAVRAAGGLEALVQEWCPDPTSRLPAPQRLTTLASQGALVRVVQVVLGLPPHEVEEEWSPPWLGGQRLDVAVPSLGLALEYHGPQHYPSTATSPFRPPQDEAKRLRCASAGVTLIEVPPTWDEGGQDPHRTLAQAIALVRPDLRARMGLGGG